MNKTFRRLLSVSHSNSANKMKGILVKEFGGPEVCQFKTDIPIPEPNDDQIQIRVYAAGVNPVDTYMRSGTYSRLPTLPYTPGLDSAGIITKLGRNVDKFKIGDRVFTTDSDSGTYAQYSLTRPRFTFHLEENLSFVEGSGVGVPYFTAYKALFTKGKAKPGETVLVHGASGAVGTASVHLAKMHGMKVIATAGTEAGLGLIRSQGAEWTINHREANYMEKIKEYAPDGVDIVLEMLANINLNEDMKILKNQMGRVVIIGNRGTIEINPRLLMAKETSICGVVLFASNGEELNRVNSHLSALFKAKAIRPVIGKTYKLEEASKAQYDIINNSGTSGRIALTVD